jgi:hypothetical protein
MSNICSSSSHFNTDSTTSAIWTCFKTMEWCFKSQHTFNIADNQYGLCRCASSVKTKYWNVFGDLRGPCSDAPQCLKTQHNGNNWISQRYRTITSKKREASLQGPLRTPKTPQYFVLTEEAQRYKPYWFKI